MTSARLFSGHVCLSPVRMLRVWQHLTITAVISKNAFLYCTREQTACWTPAGLCNIQHQMQSRFAVGVARNDLDDRFPITFCQEINKERVVLKKKLSEAWHAGYTVVGLADDGTGQRVAGEDQLVRSCHAAAAGELGRQASLHVHHRALEQR